MALRLTYLPFDSTNNYQTVNRHQTPQAFRKIHIARCRLQLLHVLLDPASQESIHIAKTRKLFAQATKQIKVSGSLNVHVGIVVQIREERENAKLCI